MSITYIRTEIELNTEILVKLQLNWRALKKFIAKPAEIPERNGEQSNEAESYDI